MSWSEINPLAMKLAIFTHVDVVFLFVYMELNGMNCFPTLSHVSVTDPTMHATAHSVIMLTVKLRLDMRQAEK